MLKIIAPISTVSLLGAFFAPDLIQTGLLIISFSLATSYLILAGNPRHLNALYKSELIKASEAVANAQNQASVLVQSALDKASGIEKATAEQAEQLRRQALKRARRIIRMARESLQIELEKERAAKANELTNLNVQIQSAFARHEKLESELILANAAVKNAQAQASEIENSATQQAKQLLYLAKERASQIVQIARDSLQDELDGERAARTNELNNLSVQIQSAKRSATTSSFAQLEKLEDLKSRTEAGIAKLKLQAQEEYATTHKSLQEAANGKILEREEYWQQVVTELQSIVDALKSENLELENRIYLQYEPKYPSGWSYPETCARTIQGLYHKEWKIILDYRGSSFDGDGATVIISLIPREPGTEIAKIFRRAREIGQALDTIDDPLLERVGSAIVFKFVPTERGMMPVGIASSAAVAHLLEGDEP